jgi:hypothetical protein
MTPPHAATPQPTACTTVPVRPSGTTPVVRPATIKLLGEEIELTGGPTLPITITCLFKKEDHALLRADERHAVVEDAIKKVLLKFKPQAISMGSTRDTKDNSLLEDEANLSSSLITAIAERHKNYDIHTPFQIVFPVQPLVSPDLKMDSIQPLMVDLYKQYTSMTSEQVAVSNFWYSSWINPIKQLWHRENLHLSYLMLVNHTVQELHQKVIETYNKFLSQYHGGPLYFKLVMDSLVTDLERMSSALLKHMTEYKIHDTKGEDVSHAVSLLCNGCDQLHSIHHLPQDMLRILVKVYQTTSNTEFNKLFELTELDMPQALSFVSCDVFAVQHHLFQKSPVLMLHLQDQLKSKCNSLHGMADAEYVHVKYSGQWTLLKGQGDSAALTTAKPLLKAVLQSGVCWNCGKEGHCLGECKKPRDNKRIDANKTAFMKLKRDPKSKKKGNQESKERS